MKKVIALGFVVLACLIVGTYAIHPDTVPPPAPRVDVQVMDPTLDVFAEGWRTEVARRFPDAVVALAHGGTFINGEWLTKIGEYNLPAMTVEHLIQHLQASYPNRTIVVLCCNPAHVRLHGYKNVWYATDSVFCVPDRAVGDRPELDYMTLSRWTTDPGVFGNIFEFISAE